MIDAIRSEAITIQLTVGILFDFQSCNFRVRQHNNNRLLTEQARLVSGLLYGTVSDSKMQWRSVSDSKMQLQKRFLTESDKSSC